MKEGTELQSLLGYQLKRLHLECSRGVREDMQKMGISPARTAALLLIRDNPGCTQSALGESLDINRSSTMKLVNMFEEMGLVRRESGADSRSNALFVTAQGEELVERAVAALRQGESSFLSALEPREIQTFTLLLQKLRYRD